MSANIVKAESKGEALRQMIEVDRSLANTITRRLEIADRKKELKLKIRETKEYEELTELSKEEKELIVEQYEKNGARKMMFALLKKFGVPVPETKLTQLMHKNENARELIPA